MSEENNNLNNDLAAEIKELAIKLEEVVWKSGWNRKDLITKLKQAKSLVQSAITCVETMNDSLKYYSDKAMRQQ